MSFGLELGIRNGSIFQSTIRVALDEAHESAENVPTPIARQSTPVSNVEKSFNRHDNDREMHGPASRAMPFSMLNS